MLSFGNFAGEISHPLGEAGKVDFAFTRINRGDPKTLMKSIVVTYIYNAHFILGRVSLQ